VHVGVHDREAILGHGQSLSRALGHACRMPGWCHWRTLNVNVRRVCYNTVLP
jgi:hypothetical protein